jgi:hypothetical protein
MVFDAPGRNKMRAFLRFVCAAATMLASTATVRAATPLFGLQFNGTGTLWDINKTTAQATNPRNTNIVSPLDLACAPDGRLFAVEAKNPSPSLFRINPTTGAATLVGNTGLGNLAEGGMTFSPAGVLYATAYIPPVGAANDLVTLDTITGVGTIIGPMTGADDVSALAWSGATLYGLDTRTNLGGNARLHTLNPATGAVLTTTVLSTSFTVPLAGMAIDPDTGTFYVATSADNLYTMNTTSGVLTLVGNMSTPGLDVAGIAFLVPEPSMAGLLVAWAAQIGLRRRR